jgi:hypothetical protein
MNIKLRTIVFVLIFAWMTLACSFVTRAFQSGIGGSMGKITGSISQVNQNTKIVGAVSLLPESNLTATPVVGAGVTPQPLAKVDLDANNNFSFADVAPGNYYLEMSLSLSPCFFGTPGGVFNGMMFFSQRGWSGIGLSFKDGSSSIMGTSEVFTVSAGSVVDLEYVSPQCY